MTAEERKQKISELLKENDSVKVTELSRLFDVSEVTVRSYLEDMEKKGLLTRIHGGAVSSYKPYYSMNLNQRLETNQKERWRSPNGWRHSSVRTIPSCSMLARPPFLFFVNFLWSTI